MRIVTCPKDYWPCMLPIMLPCYQISYRSKSFSLNDGDNYTWKSCLEELLGRLLKCLDTLIEGKSITWRILWEAVLCLWACHQAVRNCFATTYSQSSVFFNRWMTRHTKHIHTPPPEERHMLMQRQIMWLNWPWWEYILCNENLARLTGPYCKHSDW